jgi:DNA-binding LacI/PurR family transcriptional regulator
MAWSPLARARVPSGKAYLDLLIAKQVDGLIAAPCGLKLDWEPNPTSLDQAISPIPIVDDVALVGYNDLDLATLVEPPLTTVAAPICELGVVAMQMLQQLINEEPVDRQRIVLPTQLVIRRTCGC